MYPKKTHRFVGLIRSIFEPVAAKNGKLKQLSADLPLFKPIQSDPRFIAYLDRIR